MYRTFVKRLIDFMGSFLLLVILSPIIFIVTIFLSFANKGKAFFIQERPGKNERIFKIVKFKTMNDLKDSSGELLPDKDRLTKVGAFIRKTSLDEIPQLFNVLMGDMSFIGPRPLLVRYLAFYNDFERKRHNVRPGITGLAQVNGRNFILWEDRMKLDVEYVSNLSFYTDVKIVLLTIKNILSKKDISVLPSDLGRATLDVRRDPKNLGKYDASGYLISETEE